MRKLICLGFLISLFPAWAQVDSSGVTERRELLLQELFFEALAARATENPKKQIEKLQKALEFNDEIATIHYELSKVYMEEGEKEQALYHGYRAIELESDNIWMLKHYEKTLLSLQMWEDLLVIQQELLEISGESLLYRLRISETQAAMGNYKKAIRELNSIQKDFDEIIPDLAERKKNIWLIANKPKRAEKEMRRLVKVYPDVPEYWGALGNFYRANNNNNRKAKEAFLRLLELNPQEPRAHFAIAYIYRNEKNTDRFFYHLREAMKSENVAEKDRIEVLISLIRAGGNLPEIQTYIEEMLQNAESFHPESAGVFVLSGDFYATLGQFEKALLRYQRAATQPEGRKAEVFQQIIGIQLELRKIEEAAKTAKIILELFPNQNQLLLLAGIAFLENGDDTLANEALLAGFNITFGDLNLKNEFRRLLGEVNHRLKNHSESDAYFEKYLELNPNDEVTLNNFAYYLSLRKEKLDQALKMTEKSNNIERNNPTYLDTWAWVLFQKEDYSKALEIIERAIDLGGKNEPEIMEHYGDILRALGKNKEANQAYNKAIKLGGNKESIEPKILP
jgi:tetratricopeptide (TPR) repeat protein